MHNIIHKLRHTYTHIHTHTYTYTHTHTHTHTYTYTHAHTCKNTNNHSPELQPPTASIWWECAGPSCRSSRARTPAGTWPCRSASRGSHSPAGSFCGKQIGQVNFQIKKLMFGTYVSDIWVGLPLSGNFPGFGNIRHIVQGQLWLDKRSMGSFPETGITTQPNS